MNLKHLILLISEYEFSLVLVILKIFRARVSHDYLADNNLELWVCEHHNQPYLFSYPSHVRLMSRWHPRREYSYFVNSCNTGWCGIYFKCKISDLNKKDCIYNILDFFFCFDQDDYVEAPLEVKVICS